MENTNDLGIVMGCLDSGAVAVLAVGFILGFNIETDLEKFVL